MAYLSNSLPYYGTASDACPLPSLPPGTHVGYLGTSRKRVSFAEYAEELEFDGSEDSGSPRCDRV